jgi:peptidyl-prolyl cis-trans isomerase A (cyclophilin A)
VAPIQEQLRQMTDLHSSGSGKIIPVVIVTTLGSIAVDINAGAAPITAANFLQYVDSGFYDGGEFHRVVTMDNQPNDEVRIEVIQGGKGPGMNRDGQPTITLERTTQTGLQHRSGTISMARLTPDSAMSDFFICIGDQPELDFGGRRNPDGQGFAAFGEVTDGWEVVKAIHDSPYEEQRLTPPIKILRVHRVD